MDKNAELEKNESPAVDGYDCDFTTLENVYQLNRDFYAYLVEKDSVDGKKGVPADYWTLATNLKNYEKVYVIFIGDYSNIFSGYSKTDQTSSQTCSGKNHSSSQISS